MSRKEEIEKDLNTLEKEFDDELERLDLLDDPERAKSVLEALIGTCEEAQDLVDELTEIEEEEVE